MAGVLDATVLTHIGVQTQIFIGYNISLQLFPYDSHNLELFFARDKFSFLSHKQKYSLEILRGS